MHLSNAMVEEASFVPRLVPLSKNTPIAKISCGARFALAITKVMSSDGSLPHHHHHLHLHL